MALIRHTIATEAARDALPLDLADVARQAEAIKEDARRQAERVIADARTERERLIADADRIGREQGYKAGHAAGTEQGRAEGAEQATAECKQDLDALQKQWAEALEQFNTERATLAEDARRDLLKLSIRIAELVTKSAINRNPDAAAAQLEDALKLVLDASTIRITTHPDDAEACKAALPSLAGSLSNDPTLRVDTDHNLDHGSIIIKTNDGAIDATITTQLNAITDALLGNTDTAFRQSATPTPRTPDPETPSETDTATETRSQSNHQTDPQSNPQNDPQP